MPKFNKGDRVRVKVDSPKSARLYVGDLCEVVGYERDYVAVQFVEGQGRRWERSSQIGWHVQEDQVELHVQCGAKLTSKPNVGDLVQVLSDMPYGTHVYTGDICRVKSLSDTGNIARLEFVSGRGEACNWGTWSIYWNELGAVPGSHGTAAGVPLNAFDLAGLIQQL